MATLRSRRRLSVAAVLVVAFNLRLAITEVPPVLDDLGLSDPLQSLLVTVPVLCFGIAGLTGSLLRRRLGEARAVHLVLVALLVGVAARAAAPDVLLFPGTIAAASGIALLNVLLPGLVRGRYEDRVEGMTAAYTMTMTAGAALGAALTVPLRDATGSMHVALGIWALPAILAIALWTGERHAGSAAPPPPPPRPDRVALRRSGLAWSVTLLFGLQSLVYYSLLSWLPALYDDHGIGDSEAGLLLALFNCLGVVGNLVAPLVARRLPDERGPTAAFTAIAMAGLLGLMVSPAAPALLWVVVLGVAQGGMLSIALVVVVNRAGDEERATRLSSMAQGVGYLIAAAGPLIVGLAHDLSGGWIVSLAFLMAVLALQGAAGTVAGRARTV